MARPYRHLTITLRIRKFVARDAFAILAVSNAKMCADAISY
jgi:hypothetical protein